MGVPPMSPTGLRPVATAGTAVVLTGKMPVLRDEPVFIHVLTYCSTRRNITIVQPPASRLALAQIVNFLYYFP